MHSHGQVIVEADCFNVDDDLAHIHPWRRRRELPRRCGVAARRRWQSPWVGIQARGGRWRAPGTRRPASASHGASAPRSSSWCRSTFICPADDDEKLMSRGETKGIARCGYLFIYGSVHGGGCKSDSGSRIDKLLTAVNPLTPILIFQGTRVGYNWLSCQGEKKRMVLIWVPHEPCKHSETSLAIDLCIQSVITN